jgi:hypothetical protein
MKWIVTADHINARVCVAIGEPIVTWENKKMNAGAAWRAAYTSADAATKESMLAKFKAEMTEEFRLYDDDNELYYEGLCLNLDDQPDSSAFEPLDWAMGDAGCVRMDYRKKGDSSWRTL